MIEYLLLKVLHIKAGLPQEKPVDFFKVLMGNSSVRWIDAARFLEDRGDGWTFLTVWQGEYQMHYYALNVEFKQLGI